jgi:hypothetical protein
MVFQKKNIKKEIFDDYIQHLSLGNPSQEWNFYRPKENIKVTVQNLCDTVSEEYFDELHIKIAKARGLNARRGVFLELLEDPKTCIAKLAVLKSIQEIFFGEQQMEIPEESLLFNQVNKIIQDRFPLANAGADNEKPEEVESHDENNST